MRDKGRGLSVLALCAGFAVFALAGPARAADEEIQVYMDEMDKPGQFGLDIHNNYTLSGSTVPDDPGAQIDVRNWQVNWTSPKRPPPLPFDQAATVAAAQAW